MYQIIITTNNGGTELFATRYSDRAYNVASYAIEHGKEVTIKKVDVLPRSMQAKSLDDESAVYGMYLDNVYYLEYLHKIDSGFRSKLYLINRDKQGKESLSYLLEMDIKQERTDNGICINLNGTLYKVRGELGIRYFKLA